MDCVSRSLPLNQETTFGQDVGRCLDQLRQQRLQRPAASTPCPVGRWRRHRSGLGRRRHHHRTADAGTAYLYRGLPDRPLPDPQRMHPVHGLRAQPNHSRHVWHPRRCCVLRRSADQWRQRRLLGWRVHVLPLLRRLRRRCGERAPDTVFLFVFTFVSLSICLTITPTFGSVPIAVLVWVVRLSFLLQRALRCSWPTFRRVVASSTRASFFGRAWLVCLLLFCKRNYDALARSPTYYARGRERKSVGLTV